MYKITLSFMGFLICIIILSSLYFSLKNGAPEQSGTYPSLVNQSPISQDATIVPVKRIYDPTNTGIIVTEYDVRGMSMQPMIQNGDRVVVDLNYYNKGLHPVISGDVVVFENPHTLNRIIKRVLIIPGDRVYKELKERTLLVNGKVLKNSVGESYIFDDTAYKWIDIYTKSGVIMSNTYYLYGDNINASLDSRKTGPVTIEGIIGKEVGIKNIDQ